MMKKLLLSMLLSAITFTGLFAQGATTASINGLVKDSKGESLPGANVVAIHVPTGSQYGAVSRSDGKYTITNAKVGGPYKVTVSFVGYVTSVREGIYLTLGNATDVKFTLSESETELKELQVVASESDIFNSDRTGASTNITNREITNLPTIARSFQDYLRLTPQFSGGSYGGRNNLYNNTTIDGALFNNAFGLSGAVGGQTNAQPISLDAVDQMTTSIAPYDVTQGSFTGAGVNVVTRSGTNDVTGSVYYFTKNQNLAGSKVDGNTNKLNGFSFYNTGFRIGGPIIKDKLFFFANYETERRNDPGTQFTASVNGSTGANVSQVQASDLDALSSFLVSNYGYNPGPYQNYQLASNSDKATLKIDWNISTKHKFTIKYNFLNSLRDVPPSGSGSIGGRSPSQFGLPFLGNYYRINNNLNSVIAELNSSFGNNIANKFQIGYSAFRDFRQTPTSGKLFPLVDILNGSGAQLTSFGYEPFSANNILNTNVFQISDNLDIYRGKHTFTVGTYNEFYSFQNGFDPFYYSQFRFNSLSDFYASAAGQTGHVAQYQLGYSASPDGSFPLVGVKAFQLGLYGQDKYDLNEKVSLTFGLRVDNPNVNSSIAQNPLAATVTFDDGKPLYTNQVQKSSLLWSPRFGFNWDVKGDKTTQVRGGSGIFTGRVPYVWISNQASNNGLLFGSFFQANPTAGQPGAVFQPDVNYYRPGQNGNPPASANPSFNLAVTDRNFKFPQVWRTNIAIDQVLPGGIIGSLDLAFTKDINAVYFSNVDLPTPPNTASGADNRPIYYTSFPGKPGNSNANVRLNPNITNAIVLKNSAKGYSYFATIQFKKRFSNGLDGTVSYTYTDSRSVNDGGSIAQSSWSGRQVSGNPNANVTGYSQYYAQHRIIASLNYTKKYLGFMGTTIGAFYELAPNVYSGRFSYVYNGDMNGDQQTNNDLIYIPKTQSDIALTDIVSKGVVTYSAAQQWNDLNAFINRDRYLSKHRGQYAARNGAFSPWRGELDIRLLQDFYIKSGKKTNTLQFSFDIFNIGNMLNSKWGVVRIPNRTSLLTFTGYDANKVPQYQFPYLNAATNTPLTTSFRADPTNINSRWQMQIGVRYIFN